MFKEYTRVDQGIGRPPLHRPAHTDELVLDKIGNIRTVQAGASERDWDRHYESVGFIPITGPAYMSRRARDEFESAAYAAIPGESGEAQVRRRSWREGNWPEFVDTPGAADGIKAEQAQRRDKNARFIDTNAKLRPRVQAAVAEGDRVADAIASGLRGARQQLDRDSELKEMREQLKAQSELIAKLMRQQSKEK